MEKLLIAEIKNLDGIRILHSITDPVYLQDLEEEVRTRLDSDKTVNVKFYLRSKSWLDTQPEYDG